MQAGKGVRLHTEAFTLQAGRRRDETGRPDATLVGARIGFTVTKKVGNAVERNRIRRRLREAVRLGEALPTAPDTDYVVVARRAILSIPFDRLMDDLAATLRRGAERAGKPRGAARERR